MLINIMIQFEIEKFLNEIKEKKWSDICLITYKLNKAALKKDSTLIPFKKEEFKSVRKNLTDDNYKNKALLFKYYLISKISFFEERRVLDCICNKVPFEFISKEEVNNDGMEITKDQIIFFSILIEALRSLPTTEKDLIMINTQIEELLFLFNKKEEDINILSFSKARENINLPKELIIPKSETIKLIRYLTGKNYFKKDIRKLHFILDKNCPYSDFKPYVQIDNLSYLNLRREDERIVEKIKKWALGKYEQIVFVHDLSELHIYLKYLILKKEISCEDISAEKNGDLIYFDEKGNSTLPLYTDYIFSILSEIKKLEN